MQHMKSRNFRFWLGITLLVTNQPFGWFALLICNGLAAHKKDSIYSLIGLGFYAFSWGMLGLGILLSGKKGVIYSRALFRKTWRWIAKLY